MFDAIEAEETVVRERVEELESRVAELMVRMRAELERLSRLVITRETAGELLARMVGDDPGETVRETPPRRKTPHAVNLAVSVGAVRRR
ncbi:hypothetical protein QFZ82_000178 [Streptomyces sp. V4I23]|uniref:hypothetical protein n=1 Tax=Streptomyces sp. V4I23 TaxID=3042282 RepID=UPI0027858735|nr:hypothetical protein [Streptomyces sp. V4I23]MDQ1005694.1 hypothetical protein [Streptomyces sp. V4I23]